ncbi:hypothetical protein EVG20_g9592 [Dentipellis fragilis]|uniref:DUF6593 domain-containing protein n=1 Tax=Dentipellis fragilis TaxID=205917 RepID=A0A4Y9XX82_9AGAM|nr:hypothetical protein EVG20_g9592 [Dentipellis fragilis]
MNLHVSRGSFLNTVLRDDSGEPHYHIETSFTKELRGRETTVSRFLPGTDAFGSGEALPEQEIAKIEWHRFKPTLFKWLGRAVEVGTYMPYKGALWRKRAFTATDGQSYVWTYGLRRSYLARDDDTHTCIARYHRRSFDLIRGESRKAYLEISPDGLNIADEIVVTFVYIERRREQRRRRA